MKYLAIGILSGALIALTFNQVYAGGDHHTQVINNVYNSYPYVDKGQLALAMAAAAQTKNPETFHAQISLSGAHMGGGDAAIVGIAKKFCVGCPLIQFNLGAAGNEIGFSIGALWSIK